MSKLVEMSEHPEFQTASLNAPRGNALTYSLLSELLKTIKTAELNLKIRGLILTAPVGAFCTGFDLRDLNQKDRSSVKRYWMLYYDVLATLLGSRLMIVSAIRGHALGAGCILTLMTDHRVVAEGKHFLGIPAVLGGILVPAGISQVISQIIGQRAAERLILRGERFEPEAAQELGLVDEVKPSEAVISHCHDTLGTWLETKSLAFERTKRGLRQALLDTLSLHQEEDLEAFLEVWYHPASQGAIAKLVSELEAQSS